MFSPIAHRARIALIASAAVLSVISVSAVRAATPEELEARLQALASQVQALQSEVAALKAQNGGAGTVAAGPGVVAAASATSSASAPATTAGSNDNRLSWFGYGELNYTRPTDDSTNTRRTSVASCSVPDIALTIARASLANWKWSMR